MLIHHNFKRVGSQITSTQQSHMQMLGKWKKSRAVNEPLPYKQNSGSPLVQSSAGFSPQVIFLSSRPPPQRNLRIMVVQVLTPKKFISHTRPPKEIVFLRQAESLSIVS